ncbi:MAG: cyclic nucleotide-binding domain-containing protein, partial [Candidatus Nomurabacteria bacterium]|nr:cyclic nucleotide-binding domain-containing protein [Candidatus Nomurabacteria bacterium]
MDEISFNERGNAVTMRLEHLKNTTNTVPAVFQDQDILVVSRGDEIFRQGEASDFLYYVAEGEYHVIVNQKHVATITPSDILLGEMSFLLDETRSATVIAAA